MREKRCAKLANKERLQSLVLFTRFSDIKGISNDVIKDQLRTHRLQGKKGFIISHPTRVKMMLQLQALMLDSVDSEGAEVNDLPPRDSGFRDRGVRSKAPNRGHTHKKAKAKPRSRQLRRLRVDR